MHSALGGKRKRQGGSIEHLGHLRVAHREPLLDGDEDIHRLLSLRDQLPRLGGFCLASVGALRDLSANRVQLLAHALPDFALRPGTGILFLQRGKLLLDSLQLRLQFVDLDRRGRRHRGGNGLRRRVAERRNLTANGYRVREYGVRESSPAIRRR